MKLKTPVIAASLLALLSSSAQAAKELTPEQAASLKPFERITVTGRYNSIGDAVAAVAARADKLGADAFFVQGSNESNNGGNVKVTADLYHANAEKVDPEAIEHKTYDGVIELSQKEANTLVPFDTVSVSG
ncbi:MAG: YdgH/BhsA/McbA-like domain containing protein, partial [Enterobacteriaceae bacterium]